MNNFSERLNKLQETVEPEKTNFSEDQGVDTQVTDEASARALGESLAKKMWGDQYDQKIFDGVFATAIEQCGEDWNHVAAYLRKVYKGATQMNNFSERLNKLQESMGLEKTNFSEAKPVVDNKETKPAEEVTKTQTGDADKNFSKISEKAYMVWDKNSNAPYMYHESDGPNDKSTSMRYLVFKDKTGFDDFLKVMGSKDAKNYELVEINLKNFSEDSVTNPEPKNPKTPTTPAETTCPECGRKIVAEFTNLTDEEFAEITKEAKEIAKYPEQYETEGERIQAFTTWLQNSRFKDFCNEALYKAFCGVK